MKPFVYKGYVSEFNYGPEDDIFFGHIADIVDVITFQGKSLDELKKNFQKAVDDYLEHCRKTGKEPNKPYSGQIRLRLGADVHRECAAAAAQGLSLNAWMVEALKKAAEDMKAASSSEEGHT